MKKTDLLLILLFLIGTVRISYAQDYEKQTKINIDLTQKTSSWVLYESIEGINVSYKIKECYLSNSNTPQQFVLFKIENTNDKEQYHVIWDIRTYYGGICSNCDDTSYEDSVNLILNPGESKEADESSPKLNALGAFIGSMNYPEDKWLTSFELKNLEVHFLKNIK